MLVKVNNSTNLSIKIDNKIVLTISVIKTALIQHSDKHNAKLRYKDNIIKNEVRIIANFLLSS